MIRIICSIVAALIFSGSCVLANDQVVTDPGDNGGPNQLRAKLRAVQDSGGGTLTFNIGTATILLQSVFALSVSTNTTIDGGGKVTISGNDAHQILGVGSNIALSLRNITIAHGFQSTSSDGGAIINYGTLNVDRCKFLNNSARTDFGGGAIYSVGPLNISNSEFGFNQAGHGGAIFARWANAKVTISSSNFHDNVTTNTSGEGSGGAVFLWDGATAAVTKCTFSNNHAADRGGAVYIFAPQTSTSFVADQTTFTDNSTSGSGGAIFNEGRSFVTLTKSTLRWNSAYNTGGAIYTNDDYYDVGSVSLTDVTLGNNAAHLGGAVYVPPDGRFSMASSTISGNTADEGAGLYQTNSTVFLVNVTISGNSATTSGGGITVGAYIDLTNVTIIDNFAPAGGGIYFRGNGHDIKNTVLAENRGGNCGGGFGYPLFYLGDHNLSDDYTCGLAAAGTGEDIVPNLLFGPLANNGGLTMTHLPQANSAAINASNPNNMPATDQRGVARPQFGVPDVGAVEYLPIVDSITDIQYDGWRVIKDKRASGGYYRTSNTANDVITYSFNGTSIKWITRKGPDMGIASVVIDGVNRGSYDLYNQNLLWKQQTAFSGLSAGAHKITIQVTGNKNPLSSDNNVAVDGFAMGTATVQESANNVQYNNWTAKAQTAAIRGSYRINDVVGSVARCSFSGSSITLLTARGPTYGYANVYIDGVIKSSNVDLYSGTQQWQFPLTYSGLSATDHTIEVRPTHAKNPNSKGYSVVIDAFTGPFVPLP
jgi:predicted outer membrane repeat protein